MVMRISEFYEYLAKFEDEFHGQDLYVVMAAGYTEKELDKSKYELQLLEYDGNCDYYVWLNDWNEGQQFVRVWDVFPEKRLLYILTGRFERGDDYGI